MKYKLPPNDPRYLNMTRDDIVEDLLIVRYYDHAVMVARNPRQQEEDAARDNAHGQAMLQFRDAMSTDAFLAGVARGVARHRDGNKPTAGRTLKEIKLRKATANE